MNLQRGSKVWIQRVEQGHFGGAEMLSRLAVHSDNRAQRSIGVKHAHQPANQPVRFAELLIEPGCQQVLFSHDVLAQADEAGFERAERRGALPVWIDGRVALVVESDNLRGEAPGRVDRGPTALNIDERQDRGAAVNRAAQSLQKFWPALGIHSGDVNILNQLMDRVAGVWLRHQRAATEGGRTGKCWSRYPSAGAVSNRKSGR